MTDRRIPPIDRDLVTRQHDQVLTEEVDGEAVLYHEEHGTVHVLDRVATVVWWMLEEPVRLGDVIEVLVEASDADDATVARDVLRLAEQLAGLGLLDGSEPAATTGAGTGQQDRSPMVART